MNKKQFIEELKRNLRFLKKEDKEEIIGDYEEHFRVGKKKKRTEAEIAKSLGTPKEIAKDIKEELNPDSFTFLGMLNDTSIVMFEHLSDSMKTIFHSIQEFFKKDVKDFVEKKKEEVEERKLTAPLGVPQKTELRGKKNEKTKGSFIKKFLLAFFNIFVGIWILISIYLTVGSLFISGIAISLSGLATLVAAIVGIFYPLPYVADNLLMPGIFAGISILVFGILFSIASWQIGKLFSRLIRKYLRFNKRIMRGRTK